MELNHYVRVYDGDLDGELCDQLVKSFEQSPAFQRANGRGIREGLEASAWTELNVSKVADKALLQLFRRKIELALSLYNHDIGLPIPVPSSPKVADLILKRYRAGRAEEFQLHFDSLHAVSNRYLVFLWYLNDLASGGATEFPSLDFRVSAQRGRLLIFPPYWMYQHRGEPAISNDKYILSTYLLF
jgi:hypothetical protein